MARGSVGSMLGTSQTQDMVLLGVIAVLGYVIYQAVQGVKQIPKGLQTLTAPVASAIAAAWNAMTLQPNMNVLGNVLWPDGTSTALNTLTVKQDTLGNVYVGGPQGLLFQLQPSNANGDYPAVQITDPSQIGTNMGIPADFGTTPGGW